MALEKLDPVALAFLDRRKGLVLLSKDIDLDEAAVAEALKAFNMKASEFKQLEELPF